MKSLTVMTLGIAFKIWIIAVLVNTTADTLLVGGLESDVVDIFFLIALFSSLFSAPIFLVLWVILYRLLKKGSQAASIVKWLLITGIGMSIIAWALFTGSFRLMDNELLRMVIVAPLSGAIAIAACYANIKKACRARDGEQQLTEELDAA